MKAELPKLQTYLRQALKSNDLRLAMVAGESDAAGLFVGDKLVAELERDDDEGEISYQLQMVIPAAGRDDLLKLQSHLRSVLKSEVLRIVKHPKKKDLAELYVGDEFLAPIYRETDDGDVSYQLQMAILSEDLDGL
jgi:hypothetical protein